LPFPSDDGRIDCSSGVQATPAFESEIDPGMTIAPVLLDAKKAR